MLLNLILFHSEETESKQQINAYPIQFHNNISACSLLTQILWSPYCRGEILPPASMQKHSGRKNEGEWPRSCKAPRLTTKINRYFFVMQSYCFCNFFYHYFFLHLHCRLSHWLETFVKSKALEDLISRRHFEIASEKQIFFPYFTK